MLDAAVAAETYGAYDDNTYPELIEADTHPDMTHPSWKGYDRRLWASEWHALFDNADNRKKLTWRNIFRDRPSTVNYYNFYSSGEEVLDIHEGVPNILDVGIFRETGQYTWALQEKLKGRYDINFILGSSYGGWGFNLDDAAYYYDAPGSLPMTDIKREPIPPDLAALTVPTSQLRTRPFFLIGNEAYLYKEETGSNYATMHKYRLLADAFPARTLAAGKKAVHAFKDLKIDFDMQTTFKTRKKDGIYWPRVKEEWLHGDAREIAFSYVYLLFDDFVIRGGLR